MTNLKLLRRDPNGYTYGDPTRPSTTLRVKTTSGLKTLEGRSLRNYVSEIILNEEVPVTRGDAEVMEVVSIRIRLSGSSESLQTRLASLKGLAKFVSDWADNKPEVFVGFAPTGTDDVSLELHAG